MTQEEPPGRWSQATVLAVCVLLALVPWFSAAAVAPSIAAEWQIGALETALLAFAVLAIGPAIGIAAMARLRGRPEPVRMVGGRR